MEELFSLASREALLKKLSRELTGYVRNDKYECVYELIGNYNLRIIEVTSIESEERIWKN